MTSRHRSRVKTSPARLPCPGRSTRVTSTCSRSSGSCGAHCELPSREPWTRTRCGTCFRVTPRGCHDDRVRHLISATELAQEIEQVAVLDVRWALTTAHTTAGRDA